MGIASDSDSHGMANTSVNKGNIAEQSRAWLPHLFPHSGAPDPPPGRPAGLSSCSSCSSRAPSEQGPHTLIVCTAVESHTGGSLLTNRKPRIKNQGEFSNGFTETDRN
jgi:hypothetical protein